MRVGVGKRRRREGGKQDEKENTHTSLRFERKNEERGDEGELEMGNEKRRIKKEVEKKRTRITRRTMVASVWMRDRRKKKRTQKTEQRI